MSISLNNVKLKDNYQMPNLESLMEKVSEIVTGKQAGEVLFKPLDMLYAYVQTVYTQKQQITANSNSLWDKSRAHMLSEQTTMTNNIATRTTGDNGQKLARNQEYLHVYRRHAHCDERDERL